MAGRSVAALKFVGCISLGLLTGVSYTLTTITIPTFLALPSASSASAALVHLQTRTSTDLNIYTCISATSLMAAYIFSPRAFAHPYLLMSTALVASSAAVELILPSLQGNSNSITSIKELRIKRTRGLESSYEVLGDSSEGEGELTPSESDDEFNGEEVRKGMESFRNAQTLRAGLAGVGFAISVVGIWGDGF